jgi:hypothetical protein
VQLSLSKALLGLRDETPIYEWPHVGSFWSNGTILWAVRRYYRHVAVVLRVKTASFDNGHSLRAIFRQSTAN